MATLLVMGFSQRPSVLSEWQHKKSEKLMASGCLQQWDFVGIFPDRQRFGRLDGRRSRDVSHHNAARDRFLFFRVHVPSIEYEIAHQLVTANDVWPDCGKRIMDRREARAWPPVPTSSTRCGYFFDYSGLPKWAQISLLSIGEVTLSEADARNAIKHKTDGSAARINQLFVETSAWVL